MPDPALTCGRIAASLGGQVRSPSVYANTSVAPPRQQRLSTAAFGLASPPRRWFVGVLRLLPLGANAASNQVIRNESNDNYDHGYADRGDS
jgi:hypothetical protein